LSSSSHFVSLIVPDRQLHSSSKGLTCEPGNNQLFTALSPATTGDRLLRTFSGSGIRLRTLTMHRKMATVAQTSVTANLRQALNIHGYFATQITFNDIILIDDLA
jgi:hypothetical protein